MKIKKEKQSSELAHVQHVGEALDDVAAEVNALPWPSADLRAGKPTSRNFKKGGGEVSCAVSFHRHWSKGSRASC